MARHPVDPTATSRPEQQGPHDPAMTGTLLKSLRVRARTLLNKAVRRNRSSRRTGIPTEVILDGGAFLNWRSDAEIEALVLIPDSSEVREIISCSRDLPGPAHGVVDLRELPERSYRLHARIASRVSPLALHERGVVVATRNEGRVGDKRWVIHEDLRGARLNAESIEERPPAVTALNCALGIITLSVEPMLEGDWGVELRRRGSTDRVRATPAGRTAVGRVFRLGAGEWGAMGLESDDSITRWDVWAVRDNSTEDGLRLRWSGSGAADPRTSQRLRATVARPYPGSATRVRPYWTLDQHLSIEISRSKDAEGTQS